MKLNYGVSALLVLALASCKAPLAISNVQPHQNQVINQSIPDDGNADMLIAPYKKSLNEKMSSKLSYTAVELNKKGDNSNLGNLLSDFTLEAAQTWADQNKLPKIDAAVINIGGIRSTIGAGDILLKNVYEVMPFENELVIVKIKGSDLQGLFDYYLERKVNNPVSKLTIETKGNQLVKALINNETVQKDRTYYIATSDYLAMGGDYMSFFKKGEMISTGEKLRDLYVNKFKENPTINVPTDVRLTLTK